ncbi:MAG: hypothetical protein ACI30N_09085 [Muribaculaceae bacterium]
MADNYLEKKMEEHLSGHPARTAPAHRPEGLCYPLKPLRILIAATGRRHLRQYVAPLQARHCRIAIFNTLPATDTDLPADHATRYYATDQADTPFASLIAAWRDIDAVILLAPLPALYTALTAHIKARPYPNDWGTPILLIGDRTLTRLNPADLNTPATLPIFTAYADIDPHPAAAHIPYLLLRTSAAISTITLR